MYYKLQNMFAYNHKINAVATRIGYKNTKKKQKQTNIKKKKSNPCCT